MAELNFEIKDKYLRINGEDYEIKCSDFDVAERAAQLQQEYEAAAKELDPTTTEGLENTTRYVRKTRDLIDVMLGEGAMKKITNGKPVGLAYSFYMLEQISKGVAEAYKEEIELQRPKTPAVRGKKRGG